MNSASIGVVDYGSGNLRSVCKALEAVGASPALVTGPLQLAHFDALVVPGVGAFGDCAATLGATGLWDPLRDWIAADRPYLGICLGYQLLFDASEESPGVSGLGVLPGCVIRFSDPALKVPHMGWNTLSEMKGPLFKDLPEDTAFYFVHSYFPQPSDASLVSSTCGYGRPFAASVSRGRVHATQFHPEKSQAAGLAVLRNFLTTL